MDRSRTDQRLLAFLHADPERAGAAGVAELSGSDWRDLLRASALHGVGPLLYHRLTTVHAGVPVPAGVLGKLRASYLRTASRNMYRYYELGKVLHRFHLRGIAVVALKGAHLAEAVYGNIALRPMDDVDLLARREDLGLVDQNLLEMGYLPADCSRQVGGDNYHFAYVLPNKGLSVEVHWTFVPSTLPFRVDMDGQWQRSETAILGGVEVHVLCPEDLLLYLCLHVSKHLFELGLTPFCDIAATVRHYGEAIDWNQVQTRGRQAGITKCVYLALALARELLGTSVPDELLKAIRPIDFDERFLVLTRRRVLFEAGYRSVDGLSLSHSVGRLFGSETRWGKAALFLEKVFPSRDVMTRMFPVPSGSPRIYFYYLVRIRYLLLQHGRQVWRLLRGDKEMSAFARREDEIAPLRDWLMPR